MYLIEKTVYVKTALKPLNEFTIVFANLQGITASEHLGLITQAILFMDNSQLVDQVERGVAEPVLPPYTPPSQANGDVSTGPSSTPATPIEKAEIETKEKATTERRENAKNTAVASKQKPARKRASLSVRFRLWYNTYRSASYFKF